MDFNERKKSIGICHSICGLDYNNPRFVIIVIFVVKALLESLFGFCTPSNNFYVYLFLDNPQVAARPFLSCADSLRKSSHNNLLLYANYTDKKKKCALQIVALKKSVLERGDSGTLWETICNPWTYVTSWISVFKPKPFVSQRPAIMKVTSFGTNLKERADSREAFGQGPGLTGQHGVGWRILCLRFLCQQSMVLD